ncbi:MAG: hypothetical protein AB1513_02575, partial [Pseudomonadota bacterium]
MVYTVYTIYPHLLCVATWNRRLHPEFRQKKGLGKAQPFDCLTANLLGVAGQAHAAARVAGLAGA